jgi:hypothetical protein
MTKDAILALEDGRTFRGLAGAPWLRGQAK